MKAQLSKSEVNHLRRLLGYVSCEIGQTPEELLGTCKSLADIIGHDLDDEAKARLVASYKKAEAVPKYVRQAVKMLEKFVKENGFDIVDSELTADNEVPSLEKMRDIFRIGEGGS